MVQAWRFFLVKAEAGSDDIMDNNGSEIIG